MKNLLNNFKTKWHLALFPLLAIVFSSWFVYKYYRDKGLEIVISFEEAKSIQPEKTKVYYRGVPIGVVKSMSLSKDAKKAECLVELEKNAQQFAVEGSVFYLVYPKVGLEEISGLETLISGSYISIDPGKPNGAKKKKFNGELSKVTNDTEAQMTRYVVETDHAESISLGDNIFFRGIPIGSVGDSKLGTTGQSVVININIKNKYTKLIRVNTLIWKKQGIKADLGLFGSDIRINSLDTILKGGLELATPNDAGAIALPGTKFSLLDDEPKDKKKWKPALLIKDKKPNKK